jgi:hypothetical protein
MNAIFPSFGTILCSLFKYLYAPSEELKQVYCFKLRTSNQSKYALYKSLFEKNKKNIQEKNLQ